MKRKVPKIELGVELWQCSECDQWKPETAYYSDKRTPNGLKTQCKVCHTRASIQSRDSENTKRINREYMRRARETTPERFRIRERAASAKRDKSDPRVVARDILNKAVKAGKIKKPKICQKCKKARRLTGHHPDYTKPLEVEWLCYECHGNK